MCNRLPPFISCSLKQTTTFSFSPNYPSMLSISKYQFKWMKANVWHAWAYIHLKNIETKHARTHTHTHNGQKSSGNSIWQAQTYMRMTKALQIIQNNSTFPYINVYIYSYTYPFNVVFFLLLLLYLCINYY